MDRKVYAFLVVLVGVALALAGPVAGDMKAGFTGTAGAYSIDAAVGQFMSASKLEDGVAPELTVDLEVHRRVLDGSIRPPALYPNRPACIQSCPARGQSYTSRGCKNVYRCHG